MTGDGDLGGGDDVSTVAAMTAAIFAVCNLSLLDSRKPVV